MVLILATKASPPSCVPPRQLWQFPGACTAATVSTTLAPSTIILAGGLHESIVWGWTGGFGAGAAFLLRSGAVHGTPCGERGRLARWGQHRAQRTGFSCRQCRAGACRGRHDDRRKRQERLRRGSRSLIPA